MMDRHRAYFERRLVEERLAAANAVDPFVGLAHMAFVRLYKMRLTASAPPPVLAQRVAVTPPAVTRSAVNRLAEPDGRDASDLYRQFVP